MEKTVKAPKLRFPGFTDSWEQRKVNDIACTYTGGGTPSTKKDEFWNGTIPWIQSSDLTENDVLTVTPKKKISDDGLKNSAAKLVKENSIAIVTRVGVGKLAYMPYSFSTSQDFLSLSDFKADPIFVLYYLYSVLNSLNNIQGTSIKGITKDYLLSLPINIPSSYREQNKIGQLFKSLDDLITLHQRKYEHLKTIKKGFLQKMFPKEGEQYPEIRFPGFSDPWEQRKLGELGNIQTCKRIFKEQTKEEGEIPFYKNGTIGLKADAFISRELFEEFKRLYPYPEVGDILISAVGSVGRTAEYTGADEYFQDSNVVWLHTDGRVDKKYLKVYYQVIDWIIEGSTVKHLYNDNILRSVIKMPVSLDEQKKIGLYFEELDNLITLYQHKYEHLKTIKKAFFQQMFV